MAAKPPKGLLEAMDCLERIRDWLSRLAKQSDLQANCGYESLAEACRADAKNYRAVCKEIESVLRKMEA